MLEGVSSKPAGSPATNTTNNTQSTTGSKETETKKTDTTARAPDQTGPAAPDVAGVEPQRPTGQTRADARLIATNDPAAAQLRLAAERRVSTAGAEPTAGKDPALPANAATGTTRVEGDAFRTDGNGRTVPPAFSDVDQGGLGDCWLMAASAAVAHRDPEHIQGRISKNQDGSFNVRLGNDTQRVEPTFPNAGYADPTPNGQQNTLWPALIEKAYAQREGNSYARLEGGNPGRAMEALTGQPSTRTTITASSDADRLWGTIRDGVTGDHPMVLSTPNSAVASPPHQNHAYAVLDAYERDGQRYVRVYNPWGTNDNSRTADSMTHELTLDQVRANFTMLDVNGG
jgi:hypothetical protein